MLPKQGAWVPSLVGEGDPTCLNSAHGPGTGAPQEETSSKGQGGNQEPGLPGVERKQSQGVSGGFLSRLLGRRWSPVGLGEEVVRLGKEKEKRRV